MPSRYTDAPLESERPTMRYFLCQSKALTSRQGCQSLDQAGIPPYAKGCNIVPPSINSSWSERGSAAVDAGDLALAKQCFLRAVKAESGNASHRFHLAVVLEGLGELAAAAQQLTHALRLDPKQEDAARRLAALFGRADFGPSDHLHLNTIGLRNGLRHDRVDQKAIANVAVRYLVASPPFQEAAAIGLSRGWLEAARVLCLRRSGALLKDELFLDVLRFSFLSSSELEKLLTAMRRVLLLELPPERFADRVLVGFAVALMQQCWINQFVWLVSEEEERHLAAEPIGTAKLANGDLEEGRRFLKHCLYQPVAKVLGGQIDPDTTDGIQPQSLRKVIAQRLAQERDERDRAARIPRLGAIVDETSRKVAQFYEASPYPGLVEHHPASKLSCHHFAFSRWQSGSLSAAALRGADCRLRHGTASGVVGPPLWPECAHSGAGPFGCEPRLCLAHG
jgi:tetratricopeptide (TPR) repeat protein